MKQSKIQELLIEFVKKVNDLSPNNPVGNVINLNLISHDYSRKFKLILDDLQRTTKAQTRKECYDEMREIICEVVHKEKHDDINGVYVDENEPNCLVDCSAREAQCYNSGAIDQSLFIKEKINQQLDEKEGK